MQVFLPNTQVTGCIFFYVVVGVVWITITTTAILVIAFSAYIFLQSRLNTPAFAEIPNLPNLSKLWAGFSPARIVPNPSGRWLRRLWTMNNDPMGVDIALAG